jgi:hypothetical protein
MTTAAWTDKRTSQIDEMLATLGAPDTLTPEEKTPRDMAMVDLHVCPELLQPRKSLHLSHASDATVKEFVRAMAAGNRFPPILVMKIGGTWYVLDGHHRLQARYELAKLRKQKLDKAGQRGKVITHIRVTVFQGTIRQARDLSSGKNCHDKLNMPLADKLQGAWWRVAGTELYTVSEIQRATSISPSQIYFMRQTLKSLKKKYPDVTLWDEWQWADILRLVNGQEPITDQDAADTLWVASKCRHFTKTFGKDLDKKTRLMAKAIYTGHGDSSVQAAEEILSLQATAAQDALLIERAGRDAERLAEVDGLPVAELEGETEPI